MSGGGKWTLWSKGGSEWDDALVGFPDANIYQSWKWGLHRAEFGWSVLPLAYIVNGNAVAVALVLRKTILRFFSVCWVPGGPVGAIGISSDQILEAVSSATSSKFTYLLISPMSANSDKTCEFLISSGWKRPASPLNSGKTLIYSVQQDDTTRRRLLSKNWSRNLSRSLQNEIIVKEWTNPSGLEITKVTNEMLNYKKLVGLTSSESSVDSLLKYFSGEILMVRCSDNSGQTLAIRGVIKQGNKAFDMFAAANQIGRNKYASNLCLWKIIELCARDGIVHLDLSGVDLVKNSGVYNFKKGVGSTDFDYQGEWAISRPRFIGAFIGRMIARRLRA